MKTLSKSSLSLFTPSFRKGCTQVVHALVAIALLSWVGHAYALPGSVAQELVDKANTTGSIAVLVVLNQSTRSEDVLSQTAVREQRRAIRGARSALNSDLSGTRYRITRTYRTLPLVALRVEPDALAALEQSTNTMLVQEDRLLGLSLADSTHIVQADQAWDRGFDGSGWHVAILDTGVDRFHSFFSGKVVEEACFSTEDVRPNSFGSLCRNGAKQDFGPGAARPCNGKFCDHGTHVAGIAAGRGNNFSGVAKGANLIAM